MMKLERIALCRVLLFLTQSISCGSAGDPDTWRAITGTVGPADASGDDAIQWQLACGKEPAVLNQSAGARWKNMTAIPPADAEGITRRRWANQQR